ncbi:MAG: peptidoglycan DD-metalloendopeptidase family protein [Elusimicrobia bacterium]|nr:peptidoglycan DD-metalloendopeptidase family protein [Elusimicrobiota bacterium]
MGKCPIAFCAALLYFITSGCIPPPAGYKWYYIRKGDTLWSVARRNRIDLFKLIYENNIKNPSLIYPGMRLRIPVAARHSAAKTAKMPAKKVSRKPRGKIKFKWPASGKIVRNFGKHGIHRYLGITVKTKSAKIHAAAAGKVSFCGTVGNFGKTVIVKHPGNYHTVYGNLGRILTKVGERVGPFAAIATPGKNAVYGGKVFYFEIRYNTEAIDPLFYLD